MSTSIPIATAPLARMPTGISRSIVPENTTIASFPLPFSPIRVTGTNLFESSNILMVRNSHRVRRAYTAATRRSLRGARGGGGPGVVAAEGRREDAHGYHRQNGGDVHRHRPPEALRDDAPQERPHGRGDRDRGAEEAARRRPLRPPLEDELQGAHVEERPARAERDLRGDHRPEVAGEGERDERGGGEAEAGEHEARAPDAVRQEEHDEELRARVHRVQKANLEAGEAEVLEEEQREDHPDHVRARVTDQDRGVCGPVAADHGPREQRDVEALRRTEADPRGGEEREEVEDRREREGPALLQGRRYDPREERPRAPSEGADRGEPAGRAPHLVGVREEGAGEHAARESEREPEEAEGQGVRGGEGEEDRGARGPDPRQEHGAPSADVREPPEQERGEEAGEVPARADDADLGLGRADRGALRVHRQEEDGGEVPRVRQEGDRVVPHGGRLAVGPR